MNLNNQIIILTGGAGFLGSFFSDLICSYGGTPIIVDKNEIKSKNLSKKLSKKYNKTVPYYNIDITKEDDVINVKKDVLKNFKKIDSLVNNAALNPTADSLSLKDFTLENYSMDYFQSEFDVGLKGALICTKIFGQYFSTVKKGNIVNIGSTNSSFISDQPIVYTVFKSALVHLTSWQAVYYGHMNIKSNLISPCLISSKKESKKEKKINSKSIPLKKKTNISEISLSFS